MAEEVPREIAETAVSPGASPSEREEVGSPTAEKGAQSNAARTERGLRPPPGRPGEKSPGCLPFWALLTPSRTGS